MTKLQPVRGTKDLLPKDFISQEYVINTARKISELFGYLPMSTPIIENIAVFDRSLGVCSDVISKEIYSFPDKGGDLIALRPEFTAGVMRSFINNTSLWHNLPLRFFTYGPLFRYDRPQAGRQRQFHQINFEHLGANGVYSDAEIIKLAIAILSELEVDKFVNLEINSLGCTLSRKAYESSLFNYFSRYEKDLSEDSKKRLIKNPLRILDSKSEIDKEIVKNSPLIAEYYTKEAQEYFDQVLEHLNKLNINYTINPRLVRGLDYYTHTTFEFVTDRIGAQSAVLAGGRYDGLSELMSGPAVKAIGFAAGIERLLLLSTVREKFIKFVYILPINVSNIASSMILADRLRQMNIPTMLEVEGKITKRMQRIVNSGAEHVIFIGDEEGDKYKIKNILTREEEICDIDSLLAKLTI